MKQPPEARLWEILVTNILNHYIMSKPTIKKIRLELIETMRVQSQVQKAVASFNKTMSISMDKLSEQIIALQKQLIELEKN